MKQQNVNHIVVIWICTVYIYNVDRLIILHRKAVNYYYIE